MNAAAFVKERSDAVPARRLDRIVPRQPRRTVVVQPHRDVPAPGPAAGPGRLAGQSEVDLGSEEAKDGQREEEQEAEEGRGGDGRGKAEDHERE